MSVSYVNKCVSVLAVIVKFRDIHLNGSGVNVAICTT